MTPESDGAALRQAVMNQSESMKIKPGPVAGSDRATAGKARLSRTTRNDAWAGTSKCLIIECQQTVMAEILIKHLTI